jgi:hypothetical protein
LTTQRVERDILEWTGHTDACVVDKAIEARVAAAALENRADATCRCADARFVRHVNHDGRQPIGAAGPQTRAVLLASHACEDMMAPRVEPSRTALADAGRRTCNEELHAGL